MKRVGLAVATPKRAQSYSDALQSVGLEPVVLLPGQDISVLNELDGLVLAGGEDINPARYGQEKGPHTQDPNDPRDESEIALVKAAIARDMPVLAICRGCQLLNVACGGTLVQHLLNADNHRSTDPEKPPVTHEVSVRIDSKLHAIIGPSATVNSFHHQANEIIGKGIIVSAKSPDRVFEAIEMRNKKFILGVQWHPEKDFESNENSRKIFQAFADQL